MNYAPIVLFTYNRLDELKFVIEALKKNYLAEVSDFYIYSDAPKDENDMLKVKQVRNFLSTIDGFKSIEIIYREENFGLAKSIIEGVSEILDKHGKIIVLEDDLITSANFLCYMNSALDFYSEQKKVFSISGYTMPLKSIVSIPLDTYVALRPSSWGWATWKNQWENIDWNLCDYDEFINDKKAIDLFNKGGIDLSRMLKHYKQNKNNSWAIRWAYAMFREQKYSIYPKVSKVQNIGFNENATHCKGVNIYLSKLDVSDICKFNFITDLHPNPNILAEFRYQYSYQNKLLKKTFGLIRKVLPLKGERNNDIY